MKDFGKPSFSIPVGAIPTEPDAQSASLLEDSPPPGEHGREDRNRIVDQHVEDRKAERELRKKYAGLAFKFAVGGVLFWAVLLVWTGWATYYSTKPPFSDNLLIAITTATSINLFAAFLGVIRGLFPSNGNQKKT